MNHDIPTNLYYTKSHEWTKLEGELMIVGITQHAQHMLGDIVYVELPQIDEQVEWQAEVCVLESTKAASDVYAPVGGQILKVNEALFDKPELVNQDPYHNGWLFKIKPNDEYSLEDLLDADAYQAHLEAEHD